MEEKQLNKAEKLAKEVLVLSRNTLLVNLRFLDAALSQFELFPIEESSMLTDGHFLLYNPKHILSNFKHQKETVVRDYLHIVMHCVYRHMFMDPSLDRPLWDLACDIAVENVINELGLKASASFRESLQRADVDRFKKECNMLTAEKIYGYLKSTGFDPMKAADIRSRFYADNHEIWYMTDEEKAAAYGMGNGSGQSEQSEENNNGSKERARAAAVAAREHADRSAAVLFGMISEEFPPYARSAPLELDERIPVLRQISRVLAGVPGVEIAAEAPERDIPSAALVRQRRRPR